MNVVGECKLIYVHHTTPLCMPDLTREGVAKSNSIVTYLIKSVFYPYFKQRLESGTIRLREENYKRIMAESDMIVLLSKAYKKEWEGGIGWNTI